MKFQPRRRRDDFRLLYDQKLGELPMYDALGQSGHGIESSEGAETQG